MHVTVRLLGFPTIIVDAEPLKLPRRKALALLVLLIVERRPLSRDWLCGHLWPEMPDERARAELRRGLTTLNKSPLSDHLVTDPLHDTVDLQAINKWEVDVWRIATDQELAALSLQDLADFMRPFLDGFTLDIPEFSDWSRRTEARLHQRLLREIRFRYEANLVDGKLDVIEHTLELWLAVAPYDEVAHRHLLHIHGAAGRYETALTLHETFKRRLEVELNISPATETTALVQKLQVRAPVSAIPILTEATTVPPRPPLFVGREVVLETLRHRLHVGERNVSGVQRIVMQGWPGIGKTSLTIMLGHDPKVQRHFRDGILWTSLGQNPDIASLLLQWGQAMGLHLHVNTQTIAELTSIIRNTVRDKHILIIVDDIWNERHVEPFQVVGQAGAELFTTRLNSVAQLLAGDAHSVYKIPLLPDDEAVDLLYKLTPRTVEDHYDAVLNLIHDLEGLPLAIQVAGRLLRIEMKLGWGVAELLAELRNDTHILKARAPADIQSVQDEEVPRTVAALLHRSTDSLDNITKYRFALLGVFAPKPATFTLSAIQSVWDTEQARDTIRQLVERGLLEGVNGRFQIHALLVKHARSLVGQ